MVRLPNTCGKIYDHRVFGKRTMLPYTFQIEMMGDRATLRQDLLQSIGDPLDLDALRKANPYPDVTLESGTDGAGRPGVRIRTRMPESADVSHHPFQAEMDELVTCVLEGRDTSLDVFDAQKTMPVVGHVDLLLTLAGLLTAFPKGRSIVTRRPPPIPGSGHFQARVGVTPASLSHWRMSCA